MDIYEQDGPKGGEYYYTDLSDGRRLSVSRKTSDERVWLGRPGEPATYQGQPGGIGRIAVLLDEWRAQIATDPDMPELYTALSALAAHRVGHG